MLFLTRRNLVLLLACATASCDYARSDESTAPPNFIFILADDLGYGGLGCYGQQLVKTPHLDRMAAEGMRFTQAYAGGTVCAPSRCVLLTGLHGGHARIRGLSEATLPSASLSSEDVCLASVLMDAGYATGVIGKWGLGDSKNKLPGLPRQQGFDYFFGYLRHGHAHNYYPSYLWRNEAMVPLSNGPAPNAADRGIAANKEQYSHDLFVADALDFVRKHREEPFFLYLPFTIPHANNEAGDQGMEVPDFGQYADLDWPAAQKGHAAMMSRMDADVGKLLALLGELGIDDRTLVIFSSDNGPPRDEGGFDPEFFAARGPLRGYKGSLTEGGIRVPMIARWPGRIPAGKTIDAPVYFADVLPTLATIAGATPPDNIDGVDFTPTLLGDDQPELADRYFYWEYSKNGLRQQAARWRNWKAIRDAKTKAIQLYDLNADIGEAQDLATAHPEILAKFVKYFRTARSDSREWPLKVAQGVVR